MGHAYGFENNVETLLGSFFIGTSRNSMHNSALCFVCVFYYFGSHCEYMYSDICSADSVAYICIYLHILRCGN